MLCFRLVYHYLLSVNLGAVPLLLRASFIFKVRSEAMHIESVFGDPQRMTDSGFKTKAACLVPIDMFIRDIERIYWLVRRLDLSCERIQ